MSLMCAYQDCLCVKYPCSSIAFFRLPADGRRSTWIKNSGNKSLLNISEKAHRFFCESHFREADIRTQFNRKILQRHAVPIKHKLCVSAVRSEPTSSPRYSKSNKHNIEDAREESEANFVLEEVEDNTNTTQFYEDEEMPDFEETDNNNASKEQLENSYTLLDFYVTDNEEDSEQKETQSLNQDIPEDDTAEIYYVETSSNQVDSSTMDIHSDEDEDKPKKEPELLIQKEMPNSLALLAATTTENVEVTTSTNDYEEDKHFALSLVGYFQRLPKGKKALAKLKVLQYLTELDIGLSSDL